MEKRGRENISVLWPHSPSLTEYRASKVVAHGRMQVFGGECFDRRIGLFLRRSYQGSLKDKVTIIGRVNHYIRLCMGKQAGLSKQLLCLLGNFKGDQPLESNKGSLRLNPTDKTDKTLQRKCLLH